MRRIVKAVLLLALSLLLLCLLTSCGQYDGPRLSDLCILRVCNETGRDCLYNVRVTSDPPTGRWMTLANRYVYAAEAEPGESYTIRLTIEGEEYTTIEDGKVKTIRPVESRITIEVTTDGNIHDVHVFYDPDTRVMTYELKVTRS